MAPTDVAQIALYAFWLFFFGLIVWLRREDRREGYPTEMERSGFVGSVNPIFIPAPKTFLLPHGGSVQAPSFERDTREINAQGTIAGAPLDPVGDPLLSGVGPASYVMRSNEVERTRAGLDLIVPMRTAKDYVVNAGPDPRGWSVVGADGKVAGVVKDLWIDRADVMVRYLEVEVPGAGTRLLPVPIMKLRRTMRPLGAAGKNFRSTGKVEVKALLAGQFASVPQLAHPDRITPFEEERIGAFYAGGRLYAEPKRLEPLL
jgi:photosynthetic reaction center H subunit